MKFTDIKIYSFYHLKTQVVKFINNILVKNYITYITILRICIYKSQNARSFKENMHIFQGSLF